LVSGLGNARILLGSDPILGLQFNHLMIVVGLLELAIASICLFGRHHALATNLLAYRWGIWWMGWHRPCSCLGNLTDTIHVSPQMADNVMKAVLVYLLIGSYGILFRQWWTNRKLAFGRPEIEKQSSQAEAGS
jgi:hypothetical protein